VKTLDSEITKKYEEWLKAYLKSLPGEKERKAFVTPSGIPIKPLYTPADAEDNINYLERTGFPGQYPYTRGPHISMYRGRHWTKRQLAGYGSPEAYNERVKLILKAGETGIQVPCSSVSMRGFDTDQMAEEMDIGYVGLFGTPTDTLEDYEICMKDVPIDRLSVNLCGLPPFVVTAMHFLLAEKRGIPLGGLMGTSSQSDCIEHAHSGYQYCNFPIEAELRMVVSEIEWCTRNAPKWHPLSLIGQHSQEAGANAIQEVAFTLAAGICYVEECLKAGLKVDEFAPRIGAFFGMTINFLENAAKLRAARRIWAQIMRERFGAKDLRSCQLRIHTQTAGSELTRQQPMLNIVRVTLQALGAILGGAQSLHTDSWDEPMTTPTEDAAIIAIMTQNILAEETGLTDVIDPLAGSYFFEYLTCEIEKGIRDYIDKIEAAGGMVKAVNSGYIYKEINNSIYRREHAIASKEQIIVGVNDYQLPDKEEYRVFQYPDPGGAQRQIERTKRIKRERDQLKKRGALEKLKAIAEQSKGGSIFQATMDAVKENCTTGEIHGTLKEVFGEPKLFH